MHRITRLSALLGFSLCMLVGCQSMERKGGPFEEPTPPGPNESLIHLYRIDSLRGITPADIRVDGESLGDLRNLESLAILVEPGRHEVRARLRWLTIIPRSWNRMVFETQPGETVYIRVWVANAELEGPGVTDRSAPGRADRSASPALFLARMPERDAAPALRGTSQAPGR